MRVLTLALFVAGAQFCPSSALGGDQPMGIGDADRVVFYGDKVVDPPGFGFMVESFVRVRYPDSKARFWHVGTRAFEKTELANAEFDERIAPIKPTVIVLCWGLGDGDLKKHSEERVAKVAGEYELLVDRCKRLGAKVFVLTPPCPTVFKKNILKVNNYDVTVKKISEAMATVASEKQVTVLDWFGATSAAQEQGNAADYTEKDGLYPSPLADALAAEMILDALHLEPMEVRIDLDWEAGTVSSTHGIVEARKMSDEWVRLELKDFPLPLNTGKRGASFREEFACSDYCRIILSAKALPNKNVLITSPDAKPRPKHISGTVIKAGYNLAFQSPLTRAAPLHHLVDLINVKNDAYSAAGRIGRQLKDNPPDSELIDSYRTNILSREQYHEGMVKVIARTPRKLEGTMDLKVTR